ncbi:hypothetical protein N7494_005172 [Penicillium frequentans]|uniref:Zn(2)-C6 fungal-type domain-containing protein n=1 Tax=Penicillium frequentans TaxID=3151616 RepID=A0AAD6CXN0_9EURO|nr:hypothetical protein N7494_005172 [Penicillium glabrum]
MPAFSRASRIRCGGQQPCSNCLNKGRKCSYLPSKRGGPRTKTQRPSPSPEEDAAQQDSSLFAAISAEFEARKFAMAHHLICHDNNGSTASETYRQIDVLSPLGAGLRHLDLPQQVSSLCHGYHAGDADAAHISPRLMLSPSTGAQCYVRTYGSEPEILNAYYDYIHSYFPILPPRVAPQCPDCPLQYPLACSGPPSEPLLIYKPQSPLSLAISAVLALIPHPNDPDLSSSASLIQRRTYADTFAQLANTAVEAECDLDISSTDPKQALSTPRPSVNRERLHPQTPEELETLLALLILSMYEHSQRGNLLKMRWRAGQALALAFDNSLHDYVEEDEFCEARRRAWWMTYYCVIQGAIESTTPPTLFVNDPQFTTPYPRFSSDVEGWSILMQAQQVLVSATQFIAGVNKTLASQLGLHYVFERMQQLDSWTNYVLAQTEILPITSHEPDFGDCWETITAQCIRTISRTKLSYAQIKIHRFRACSDIPIFVKRHCDLSAANAFNTAQILTPKSSSTGFSSVSCPCSNPDQFRRAPSADYMTPSDSSTSSDIHPYMRQ